ncbi:M48 family metalloprotease [Chitinophaga arvensicola]|uniref:Peptidase family M48 n=1 Tax=Chitinophaga arvensicola TaxID=29529 RepID=A0A1I0RVE1_9BACT|nr:M48 family metalloprotease [Chitinophaga arvensicola]SEW45454.1 Peptidase family M48 [Chitinophaga arvensicola]
MSMFSFQRLVMARSCIVFLLCIAVAITGNAQMFKPVPQNERMLASLEQQFETHYKANIAQLPAKNKKELTAVYDQRWDNIKSKFDKQEIYTATGAQQYLDALVKEIIKANPLLQPLEVHCYFSRSGVPNASYIGEGIILFNMGLFKELENESQAVFVLCHELAHYYLQHSENSIARYVNTMNGKDMQDELKKIKSSEYGKRERLEQLMKGLTFNSRKHSRDHESAADSMGMIFMQHTRFNLEGALSALTLLDNIDVDTLRTAEKLQQLFNAPDYPFRKRWISKREGLLGGHAKLEKDDQLQDSLKTHPDCKKRINLLKPYTTTRPDGQPAWNIVSKPAFDSLRQAFKYEIIAYAYENDNYTRSLYYTLLLLQEKPGDPYLVTQIGKILNSCYDAQQTHTLGKLTELPAPDYPANYNVLLQMIQNLYLEEYPAIAFYYLSAFHTQMNGYAAFMREYNKARQLHNQ